MSSDRETAQQRYAAAELERLAHEIATTGSGSRNAALNRAALAMGHLVGARAISNEQVEAKLTAAALRAGLRASEARSTIRSGLAAGAKSPAFRVDRERDGSSPRPRAAPIALPEMPVADPAIEAGYQALIADLLELCSPMHSDVSRYLESRCLPTDVPDVFGLPPIAQQPALIAELAARHGRAALAASGMFDGSCTALKWSEHRLAFIWRDAISGAVATVQCRYLGDHKTKTVVATGRGRTWPLGAHLLSSVPRSVPVAIVEGPTDWLGWKALYPFADAAPVVALPSATALRPEWLALLAKREVFVALDADEAGELASTQILEQLAHCARAIRVRPPAKDWCELLAPGYRSEPDDDIERASIQCEART